MVDGVDTIDASLVDTSLVGLRHSYFGDKRSILNDMFNPDHATTRAGPAFRPSGRRRCAEKILELSSLEVGGVHS